MRRTALALAASVLVTSVPAASQETITYTYDDRGRLVSVARTGSVNNGATTNYTLDKADNRTSVVTAGATALPSTATTSPFLVVPLNGLAIIPIPN